MNKFINIGPLVKAEISGNIYYGQYNDGYLFTDNGIINVIDAVITEVKQDGNASPNRLHPEELLTDNPETPYERYQLAMKGNFYKEQESEHDEIKQWHYE